MRGFRGVKFLMRRFRGGGGGGGGGVSNEGL